MKFSKAAFKRAAKEAGIRFLKESGHYAIAGTHWLVYQGGIKLVLLASILKRSHNSLLEKGVVSDGRTTELEATET